MPPTLTPLQEHIPTLESYFPDMVKSEWLVGLGGRQFLGIAISCPPFLSDLYLDKCREIVGENFTVAYLPNQQEIIIE